MRLATNGLVVVAAALALGASSGTAAFPPDADWTTLTHAGSPVVDAVGDVTLASRDIVGTAAQPALFATSDATALFLRLRLDDSTIGLSHGWGCELSTDGDDDDYEVLVLYDGSDDQVEVWANTIKSNTPGDEAETLESFVGATAANVREVVVTSDVYLDLAVPRSALPALSPVRFACGANASHSPVFAPGASTDVAGVGPASTTLTAVISDPLVCGDSGCSPPPPTLVEVSRFRARTTAAGVELRWTAARDGRILGFNLYRQQRGKLEKLNGALIPSVFGGTTSGHAYSFLDRSARRGVMHTYRLQAVSLGGTRSWLGTAVARR